MVERWKNITSTKKIQLQQKDKKITTKDNSRKWDYKARDVP